MIFYFFNVFRHNIANFLSDSTSAVVSRHNTKKRRVDAPHFLGFLLLYHIFTQESMRKIKIYHESTVKNSLIPRFFAKFPPLSPDGLDDQR